MLPSLAKAYAPQEVEERWAKEWIRLGVSTADPAAPGAPFSIVIPPPNVTGSLHMGHALNNTLQDILIRYKRMDGFNALWVPGTDHAGSRRRTSSSGSSRRKGTTGTPRPRGVRRAHLGVEERGRADIIAQLKRLGASADWTRERFTMDDGPVARGARGLRPPLRGRPDLPRRAPHQLVPALRDGALRPRGRARGRQRASSGTCATRSPTAAARSVVATTRPETHARRHRGRGAPRRRALPRAGRQARCGCRIVGREIPIVADELRRSRVRHRRGQDHAGARLRTTSRSAGGTACR